MDISALKAQIKTGKLDKFYIFVGPEVVVEDIYLNQMATRSNREIKKLGSITDLTKKAHIRSALSNAFIYVLSESKEFISDDSLLALITQNNTFSDCSIVVRYSVLDKRSKLYKRFQDRIVEFDYLKPDILTKYIQRDYELSDKRCAKLIDICGSDYSRILLELDKVKNFSVATHKPFDMAFDDLIRYKTIYVPPHDAVFDFVDAVLSDDISGAFKLLEESYASGESTLVLLSNLYNNAKAVLQVQSYSGSGKITEATGLTPFQVKLATKHKGVYFNGDLVYIMQLVREAEKGIKTGAIEDMMAVPYVLVNLW